MLSRYAKTSDGNFIIDVSAPKVEALYNDFDKSAPYIRRDLDHDLVDYLIECARELKRESFVLRFTIDQSPNDDKQSRIRRSVNRYFVYLAACEQQRVMQMLRRSVILLCVGLAILFLSVSVNHGLGTERSVAANVFRRPDCCGLGGVMGIACDVPDRSVPASQKHCIVPATGRGETHFLDRAGCGNEHRIVFLSRLNISISGTPAEIRQCIMRSPNACNEMLFVLGDRKLLCSVLSQNAVSV